MVGLAGRWSVGLIGYWDGWLVRWLFGFAGWFGWLVLGGMLVGWFGWLVGWVASADGR